MEVELDCEVIILEVEKYPILYSKGDENYKSRNARIDAWKKVVAGVVGEEKLLEFDEDKVNEIGRDIQKKWKALRDAYLRSLRTQIVKSGSGASKRRPYPYQQQMAFLRPVMENRQTSGNMAPEEVGDVNAEEEEDDQQPDDLGPPPIKKPAGKPKKGNFETQLLEILKEQSTPNPPPGPSDDNDDNKLFLLSLLPKMRQLSENASLQFRIQVMQCLQECYSKSKMESNCSNAQQLNLARATSSQQFHNQCDGLKDTFSPGPGQSNDLHSPASLHSQP
ncbi:uncharacterized protein LOC120350778 [Nilaparvata lugens]|uniref:uncharacterized protein LOC120350778 n=1 Tax=Nilaparvata lugens TaxID=108931 RepID=UPI00193D0E63|nr:uncharacterized protein LOC120350778 [Nilaparvata lugens]